MVVPMREDRCNCRPGLSARCRGAFLFARGTCRMRRDTNFTNSHELNSRPFVKFVSPLVFRPQRNPQIAKSQTAELPFLRLLSAIAVVHWERKPDGLEGAGERASSADESNRVNPSQPQSNPVKPDQGGSRLIKLDQAGGMGGEGDGSPRRKCWQSSIAERCQWVLIKFARN